MKKVIILTMFLAAAYVSAQDNLKEPEKSEDSGQKISKFTLQDPVKTVEDFGAGKLESISLGKNGAPKSIYGDVNKGITATDPVDKCYQLFELHKGLFGIDNPREELVLYKINRSFNKQSISTIKFYQVHKGIKIRHGCYFFHFNRDGTLNGANGNLYPNARHVDIIPTLSEEQAKQIAVNDPRTRGSTLEHAKKAELMIINHKGRLILAWNVNVTNLGAGISSDFYVDAKTGEMLKEVTNLRF